VSHSGLRLSMTLRAALCRQTLQSVRFVIYYPASRCNSCNKGDIIVYPVDESTGPNKARKISKRFELESGCTCHTGVETESAQLQHKNRFERTVPFRRMLEKRVKQYDAYTSAPKPLWIPAKAGFVWVHAKRDLPGWVHSKGDLQEYDQAKVNRCTAACTASIAYQHVVYRRTVRLPRRI
jgi:hypothetical protein